MYRLSFGSGADFYVDASGNDNWDVAGDQWYVLAIIATLPATMWMNWMDRHLAKFHGIIHWANSLCGTLGSNGKPKSRMPDPVTLAELRTITDRINPRSGLKRA